MKVTGAQMLKAKMKRGRVYRREEIYAFSSAVDRDLKLLVEEGGVVKAGPGLYYRPRISEEGPLPAEDRELVKAFLKDDNFLLVPPSA